jgi:outer membrane protein with beta-barrel domain
MEVSRRSVASQRRGSSLLSRGLCSSKAAFPALGLPPRGRPPDDPVQAPAVCGKTPRDRGGMPCFCRGGLPGASGAFPSAWGGPPAASPTLPTFRGSLPRVISAHPEGWGGFPASSPSSPRRSGTFPGSVASYTLEMSQPAVAAASFALTPRGPLALATVVISLALLATVAPAAADSPRWTLRARAVESDYRKDARLAYGLGVSYFTLDGGSGFEFAAELRPNNYLGWELSAGRLSLDAASRSALVYAVSFDPLVLREEIVSSSDGHLILQPIALSLLIHPLRAGPVDLYVGPQVAWVPFDVDDAGLGTREPEPAYGAKLGAELRFSNSSWSAGLELRHLEIVHEAAERDLHGNIGITTASLGLAYRPRAPSAGHAGPGR